MAACMIFFQLFYLADVAISVIELLFYSSRNFEMSSSYRLV